MLTVNIALLSYGLSGQIFHAPFIAAHKGFNLLGSWERSTKRIGNDYPGTTSYPSLGDLLNDPNVDLVVVNTPTSTHYSYALQALNAGKHVLVEKAFTTTVAEARHLKEVAESKQLILSVFQNRRWDSDFRTVKQIISEGRVGSVHTAILSFQRFRPALKDKQHFEQPGPGAGLLNDLGPHLIDQALHLFGMPESVNAHLRLLRPGTQVEDDFDLQLFYQNFTVRLQSSLMNNEVSPAFIVHGDKGSFVKKRSDKQEELLRKGHSPSEPDWYTEPETDYGALFHNEQGSFVQEQIISQRGSYLDFYNALYEAVVHHKEVPITANDGINVMRIIETARQSNAEQRRIAIVK